MSYDVSCRARVAAAPGASGYFSSCTEASRLPREASMASEAIPAKQSRKGIFAASVVGTSIEWYDYYIFGTAAALVLGSLFYPKSSPTAVTLAAFATIAIGFAVRPL